MTRRTKMPKAIVLLSGGLDSCVTAAIARDKGYDLHFLNVYYGQRHSRERLSAQEIARFYGGKITELDIIGFGKAVQAGTVLTGAGEVPANRSEGEMSEGKAPSYVPGRNTIMLALAQSLAEALEADCIYCGVNAVDYSGYVDCRPAFIAEWNSLAEVSTFRGVGGNPIWVESPLIEMTKVQIVEKGQQLGAPLELSWSCYNGGELPCNTCDSCQIRNAAFAALGQHDPFLDNPTVNNLRRMS
jgi:7-cyano-7-deazaguanine synthase